MREGTPTSLTAMHIRIKSQGEIAGWEDDHHWKRGEGEGREWECRHQNKEVKRGQVPPPPAARPEMICMRTPPPPILHITIHLVTLYGVEVRVSCDCQPVIIVHTTRARQHLDRHLGWKQEQKRVAHT